MKKTLAAVRQTFDPRSAMPLRWVDETRMHLTLAFLGNVPRDWLPNVGEALARAVDDRRALQLSLGGLGAFPSTRRPRVLFASVSGEVGPLAELQHAIARELSAIEVPLDDHPFEPHLTLARLRHDAPENGPSAVADGLSRPTPLPATTFVADRIELVRSELGQGPPRYEVLATFALRASGA